MILKIYFKYILNIKLIMEKYSQTNLYNLLIKNNFEKYF
jgi:hypothetical protein